MACDGAYIYSTFFWATLSGFCTGFALNAVTRFPGKRNQRALSWKWVTFSLYLSTAIVLALAAVLVPSLLCEGLTKSEVLGRILEFDVLYMFLGCMFLGFAALRYKKAVGIPAVVVLALAVAFAISVKYPWKRLEPGSSVAEFRLLSISGNTRRLEVVMPDGKTTFVDIEGPGLQVEVKKLNASGYYFSIEKPFMYRIEGITDGTGLRDVSGNTLSPYQNMIQNLALRLPGWSVTTDMVSASRMLPLFRYQAFLDGPGGPRIELIEPKNR